MNTAGGNPVDAKARAELLEQPHHVTAMSQGGAVRMLTRVSSVNYNSLMVTMGIGTQVSDPFRIAKAWPVMPALNLSPRGETGSEVYDLDRLGVQYEYDYTPDETEGQARLSKTVPPPPPVPPPVPPVPPELPLTESQIVIPAYFVGALILIGSVPANFEGEIAEYRGPQPPPQGTPPVIDDPSGLILMDITPRRWAESWIPVEPIPPTP